MKQIVLILLSCLAPFAAHAALVHDATVKDAFSRDVQPIYKLRPLSEGELKARLRGYYLTPISNATDQCSPYYDGSGNVTCIAPMNSYRGTYRVIGNQLIVNAFGHNNIQVFFSNKSGKVFSSYLKEKRAIEVQFFSIGEEVPVRFQ